MQRAACVSATAGAFVSPTIHPLNTTGRVCEVTSVCRPSRVEASAEVCVLQDMPDMSVNETPAFLLLEEAQKKRGRPYCKKNDSTCFELPRTTGMLVQVSSLRARRER